MNVRDEAPPLTARQLEVLRAIEWMTERHGYPPTVRELGILLGIVSNNGVADHLRALRRKGWVTWRPGAARTLRVLSA